MESTETTHRLEDNAVLMIHIDKLKIHPVNKQIYVSDEKRRAELLESIKEHGILEPLIVTADEGNYIVLSGARRFVCARELGYAEVPCIVSVVKDPALAIIEHNRYRQKTPIEIYNEAQILRTILEPEAEKRMLRGKRAPELAHGQKGRVRRIIADKLNVSHGYLSMLESVVKNREEIPHVVKRLETGRETVYSAYKQLKAQKTKDVTVPNLFIGHYFAGKQRLIKDIIARMPDHKFYVEPFGGFCSVLLNKPRSKVEVYNDISKDVVNLLVCIKEHPFRLFSELSLMPYSRWLYEQLIGVLDETFEIPDVQRAVQWYYLNESTFSGIHSKQQCGGAWGHGATKNHALQTRRKAWQVLAVARRLYGVQIENRDYKYALEHYDGEDVFFYLDPPYYETDDALGISLTKKQHEELNECLKVVKGKWLLTYNDVPEIWDLYREYEIDQVTLPKVASDSRRTGDLREYYNHLIIRNYGEVAA